MPLSVCLRQRETNTEGILSPAGTSVHVTLKTTCSVFAKRADTSEVHKLQATVAVRRRNL